jgi:hypothetical protein
MSYEAYTPPESVKDEASKALTGWNGSPDIERLAKALAAGDPINTSDFALIKQHLKDRSKLRHQEWRGLGAWAGLNWIRRVNRKELEKNMGKPEFNLTANISKINEDQHLVFGWVSMASEGGQPVVDLQGDVISESELEKCAYSYVLKSRQGGVMHLRDSPDSPKVVGTLVESIVFTPEKQEALGINLGKVGWWCGFKIHDDNVWKSVKNGEFSAFSIHGWGTRKELS